MSVIHPTDDAVPSASDPNELPEEQPVAPAAAKVRMRKRGQITKWLAIIWLAALTFTAIGASWLPYVKHSCSQYANASECSTHVKSSPLTLEKPPVWATFSKSALPSFPGAKDRVGWFGTDSNGFDIFSRSMFGARNSLLIGSLSIVFGLLIGGLFGLLAGYKGGRTDSIIDTIMNVMLAFPALLLAIFIVGFFTNSSADAANSRPIWPVIFALVILSIPPLTRLVRANTMMYAQREFVTAARSLGAGGPRIVFREILPNVVPAMLTFALTGMAILIVAEGALAYLGLSVSAPTPTWGSMIFGGQKKLETAWWISMMPAITMFLTVLSINLLGDVLAERFRVREAIG
ncbi:MAG: ABC transporter permease [Ilumatobacteraceae bacterium]